MSRAFFGSKEPRGDVREIMTSTSYDLGDIGTDNTFGSGLINAESAVRRSHALYEDEELANLWAHNEILA